MSGDHNANQKGAKVLAQIDAQPKSRQKVSEKSARVTKGTINLRPTKLIIPMQYMNILRYLPPVKKARSVRGRRSALNRRGKTPLAQLFETI